MNADVNTVLYQLSDGRRFSFSPVCLPTPHPPRLFPVSNPFWTIPLDFFADLFAIRCCIRRLQIAERTSFRRHLHLFGEQTPHAARANLFRAGPPLIDFSTSCPLQRPHLSVWRETCLQRGRVVHFPFFLSAVRSPPAEERSCHSSRFPFWNY